LELPLCPVEFLAESLDSLHLVLERQGTRVHLSCVTRFRLKHFGCIVGALQCGRFNNPRGPVRSFS
jgi:hypothetical protein